jgi:hypothetical protein
MLSPASWLPQVRGAPYLPLHLYLKECFRQQAGSHRFAAHFVPDSLLLPAICLQPTGVNTSEPNRRSAQQGTTPIALQCSLLLFSSLFISNFNQYRLASCFLLSYDFRK